MNHAECTHTGVKPKGRSSLETVFDTDGVPWQVYPFDKLGLHFGFKLVAGTPVTVKANYKLYYSFTAGRLTRNSDWLKLKEQRPALEASVSELIKNFISGEQNARNRNY